MLCPQLMFRLGKRSGWRFNLMVDGARAGNDIRLTILDPRFRGEDEVHLKTSVIPAKAGIQNLKRYLNGRAMD
jgi:hypothetical protein